MHGNYEYISPVMWQKLKIYGRTRRTLGESKKFLKLKFNIGGFNDEIKPWNI